MHKNVSIFRIFFLLFCLSNCASALNAMDHKTHSPSYLKKTTDWVKRNPLMTAMMVGIPVYFIGTPGGRQLASECLGFSKNVFTTLMYNPAEGLRVMRQNSPVNFEQGAKLFLNGISVLALSASAFPGLVKFMDSLDSSEGRCQTIVPTKSSFEELKCVVDNQKEFHDKITEVFSKSNFYGDLPEDLVVFIKNVVRKRSKPLCNSISKGILFYGPPGNGKTLSLKIAAQSCGIPLVILSTQSVVTKWQGSAARSIDTAFSEARAFAKKYGHSILFIDEVELIASDRGDQNLPGEINTAITSLLLQMDGVANKNRESNITVVAATNRKDLLDGAFMRPERIDTQIEFKNPDEKDRNVIFLKKLEKSRYDVSSSVMRFLIPGTEGFSAAECNAIIKNAEDELYEEELNHQDGTPLNPKITKDLLEKHCLKIRKNKGDNVAFSSQGLSYYS